MRELHHFIDGQFRPSRAGNTFDDVNPVDGKVIARVAEGGAAEVEAAVAAARAALAGPWSRLSAAQRAELLYAVADGISARAEDFVAAEIADTGKPRALAAHLDIPRGAANFKVFADVVKNVATECFEMTTPTGRAAMSYARRRPRGVIAVVCPWNLPLLLMTWKVAPALACGNTVVVKPSEETPATATLLGEVMNAAGVPRGVYNVVHGFGPKAAGELLTTHRGIDAITFTGETHTGAAIIAASAPGIKPVSMELGGKNPALIFADADLETVMAGLSRSVFENAGQVCLGTERVYVERPLFADVVARLGARARGFVLGDPDDAATTMGPLISAAHRAKVLSYYARAVEAGATVIAGGGVPEMKRELAGGFWIEPTVWTDLPEDTPVMQEEIFGPCCHVRPFDGEAEAVRLANDTPYGLAASVYTRDLSRAHRVAAQLQVGVAWVNCWFVRDLRTAFGGSKLSGIGREGGVHSLEFYSELTNVCVQL
jgi:aminomuconate-semialdehyde/2-hydroxymuconate-6-semialdehyde dehydrogenase